MNNKNLASDILTLKVQLRVVAYFDSEMDV
jgi:hypothetical protein